MTLDKPKLLRWLTDKANHSNVVVLSIYKGLADRISRGDFDKEGDD